jgi:hypothetical protein
MGGRIRNRVPVLLDGELISNRGHFFAVVNNISENGIFVKIPLNEKEKNHSFDLDFFSLKLQLPTGDLVNLNCTKKWSYQHSSGSLIEHMGIGVIDPPKQYKIYFNSLRLRYFTWQ